MRRGDYYGLEHAFPRRSTAPSKPVSNVGLVGCGNWGRLILRDLRELGCEVAVVARSETSVRRAEDGGASAVVAKIEELPEVAGVVVAAPMVAHAEVVEAVLPRGVPIFVEKPLTNDPVWAERITAMAPNRVFVMDKWRYHPGVELMGEIARSGEFGRVIGLETMRTGWGNPHTDVDAIWHLAPHDLAVTLEVLGFLPQSRSARADWFEGTPAGIIALLGDDPWVRLEVSSRSTRRVRSMTLRCQEAVVNLADGYSDALEILVGCPPGDQPPAPTLRPISSELPLLRELRAFVDHLAGGPPPRSSVAEGALIVATIARLRSLAGITNDAPS